MHAHRAGSRIPEAVSVSAVPHADDEGDLSLASRALHSPTIAGSSLLRRSLSQANNTRKRSQTLRRANELPTAVLPPELLARTRTVIETIAIVNFDLDAGPEFDNCYPACNYSTKERAYIAFSSFPDHTEKGNTSLTFSWRIPRINDDEHTPRHDDILYGYVYFSQEKDESIRRGYAQRSIVLITKNAGLPGLYTKLVNILGPMYFGAQPGSGHASLIVENAIHNICKWPPLEPGTIELAFLGQILLVEIPLPHQAQFRIPQYTVKAISSSSTTSLSLSSSYPSRSTTPIPPSPASIPLLAALPSTSLSRLLRETISQLWLIWELMILAEPILVFSSDPAISSEVIQWLLTIVKPLPFAGDYRPFFHIHTPDFAVLLNNNKPRPGILLGATNPLILSGARHYPHIIKISPPASSYPSPYPPHQQRNNNNASNTSSSTSKDSLSIQGVFGSVSKATSSSYTSSKETTATAHGISSQRKRHVKKDTVALKAVEEKLKILDFAAADAILLQCMSTLTERFLVPLNRYFATLLPADLSDGMATPKQTSNFTQAGFLQSLKTHGTPLPFRRSKIPSMNMHAQTNTTATPSAIAFYEHFLRCPNFLSWLRGRSEATQHTTRARYLQRLENGDTNAYLRGKTDAEMEDLQRRLEREASLTEQDLHTAPVMIRQRSFSHDATAMSRSSPFSGSPSQHDLLKRSERLKLQVERVKAMRQANADSDDSDASSIPSNA